MCEQDDFGGFVQSGMTRRRFGSLALGAGVGLALPKLRARAMRTSCIPSRASTRPC